MAYKLETRKDYLERINRVLVYINEHLDKKLSLSKLASLSNFSEFHFHRIMRAYLHESLNSFVHRLRLDKAAFLIDTKKEQIQDIAMMVGYESSASFTKAFKKRFGVAPLAFRNHSVSLSLMDDLLTINKMEVDMKIKPKIKKINSKRVVYYLSIGPYDGEGTSKAWEKVCDFASKKKLWGFGSEMLGISYDDPEITEGDKLRYEACITVSRDVVPEGEIGVKTIEGGNYAIFRHNGSYARLNETYDYIFKQWLPESGYELRDLPCFEKYLNDPDKTSPEKLKTDIYLPLI